MSEDARTVPAYANEIAPRSVTPQPIAFHSTAVFRSVGSNMGQVALVRALAFIATLWDKLLMSAVWLEAFIAGIISVASVSLSNRMAAPKLSASAYVLDWSPLDLTRSSA